MMRWKVSLDEETHVYTVVDEEGHVYHPKSTTTYIKELDPAYNGVPENVLTAKATHGTAVHKALDEFNKTGKTPFLEELSPLMPVPRAVAKARRILEEHNSHPRASELPVIYMYENEPLYVGTTDLITELDGKLCLLDYKTTSELHMTALRYQLTAYKMAVEQMTPWKIEKLYALWLPKASKSGVYARLVEVEPMDEKELCEKFENIHKHDLLKKKSEVVTDDPDSWINA